MYTEYCFSIAEFKVRISFAESKFNTIKLLPSLLPFMVEEDDDAQPLFHLHVDDTLKVVPKAERERIDKFDTGNGDTVVDHINAGGYQFIVKDVEGRECALIQTNKNFNDCRCALNGGYNQRCFGLNNALMLIFAFASSFHQTLMIHASLVRHDGYGYAFIAKSGTGKSTQVSMWLRYIDNCDLMNDDNPIVRYIDGKHYIYGSPWSGKTPCYRNVKAPLGAITRIDRAKKNSVDKLGPVEAFASFLPACSTMKWDKELFDAVCNNVTKVIETTGMYTLHCLPDEESARICQATIKVSQ